MNTVEKGSCYKVVSGSNNLNRCGSGCVQLLMTDSPLKKLVVRKAGSNTFLRATGRWTKKAEAAFNFPTLVDAIHTCLSKGLKRAEFILRFEGDNEDQCFALDLA